MQHYEFGLILPLRTTQIAHHRIRPFANGKSLRRISARTIEEVPEGSKYELEFIAIGSLLMAGSMVRLSKEARTET